MNPVTKSSWVIDYRIYDPEGDGKTKINHLLEMLQGVVFSFMSELENRVNGQLVCESKSNGSD